jgi:hypothetical protein
MGVLHLLVVYIIIFGKTVVLALNTVQLGNIP